MFCAASERPTGPEAAGKDDYDYWWTLPGSWVEEPNERRSGWSGVIRAATGNGVAYVKRQRNHLFRSLRHPLGWPTASREWHFLLRLRALGIAAPTPLFHAVRHTAAGIEAVLATAALEDYHPLHELQALPAARRAAVAQALGQVLGRLHRARLQHGCLYDKHVMIRLHHDAPPDVALLDLEKMHRRLTPAQAARHDLTQLRRHQGLFDDQDWTRLLASHAHALAHHAAP
ncbi:lipopolysaccharide kinase InaA family protein [Thauera linaloolentis]|uniref:InaA protein n=1 Tax=Thauera linaloolentis (strain DSM 12138 / JCM 21573 / CCUG 41526 / CIP 105981 / IAM 15112 / NBRC 102519 / 47Lol) TaxID=1123367 RepID=N6YDV9_THAL4|nr:lipopolysaccharide kinase InaA family protein [Thauera linaloolentis]ENO89720.1 InaA protein [Thauera linaloolentis 47Lol = DSM 12138]MCM8566018.1 lipopolysaccharide kinase InaA family protein [Thauera linaloolentis]